MTAFTNFEKLCTLRRFIMRQEILNRLYRTLEDYKKYTSEHKDPERDPEEYDYYCSLVDDAIEDMRDHNQGETRNF